MDTPLIIRIGEASQAQLSASGQLLLSQTLGEAEIRVARWEALVADPQWDHMFPIAQVLSLDYLAMAHLDQSRWDAQSPSRTRALAAWQSILAGFPDASDVHSACLQIHQVPADQPLTHDLVTTIASGSEGRIDMGHTADESFGPQRAGAPLQNLLRPRDTCIV